MRAEIRPAFGDTFVYGSTVISRAQVTRLRRKIASWTGFTLSALPRGSCFEPLTGTPILIRSPTIASPSASGVSGPRTNMRFFSFSCSLTPADRELGRQGDPQLRGDQVDRAALARLVASISR
jgi:hypothetical protein